MAGKGRRRLVHWLLTLVVFYVVICGLMFFLQRRMIYLPGPPPHMTPTSLGLEHEELRIQTEDGLTLHGWWIPRGEPIGTVLVCHGNAGSIENRLWLAQSFHEMGLAVLLFDYRGYGHSEGHPAEQGLYKDARAAFDVAAAKAADPTRILAYGESLGGAVAIMLALERPVCLVVTEAAFSSMVDMGRKLYPWLPVGWLTRERFPSLSRVPRLTVPHIHLHSPTDDLVPFEQGRRLYHATAHPGAFIETDGGHNDGGFVTDRAARHTLEAEIRRQLTGS